MDLADLPAIPCFAGVPVTIDGGVCEPMWTSAYYGSAWRGVAHAPEPLRAIAFMTSRRESAWVKSYPSWGEAVLFELDFPRGGATNVQVSIASYVWPEARRGAWDELGVRARGDLPGGTEIQVPVRECGWHHFLTVVGGGATPAVDQQPVTLTGETGKLIHVLTVAGADPVSVDLLLLPRRQTRKRRNKIWGVKDRYRPAMPREVLQLFDSGRRGCWPPDPTRIQRRAP